MPLRLGGIAIVGAQVVRSMAAPSPEVLTPQWIAQAIQAIHGLPGVNYVGARLSNRRRTDVTHQHPGLGAALNHR